MRLAITVVTMIAALIITSLSIMLLSRGLLERLILGANF